MVQACNQALESRRRTDALGSLASQPSLISEPKKVNECVPEEWYPNVVPDLCTHVHVCTCIYTYTKKLGVSEPIDTYCRRFLD